MSVLPILTLNHAVCEFLSVQGLGRLGRPGYPQTQDAIARQHRDK